MSDCQVFHRLLPPPSFPIIPIPFGALSAFPCCMCAVFSRRRAHAMPRISNAPPSPGKRASVLTDAAFRYPTRTGNDITTNPASSTRGRRRVLHHTARYERCYAGTSKRGSRGKTKRCEICKIHSHCDRNALDSSR